MSALNTLKIRVVLQGSAKFRDGRKWKKRFCLLALSPHTPDAMHLYVTKSYDEFTPYRNHGCMVDVPLPLNRDSHDGPPTSTQSYIGTDVSSSANARKTSNTTHVETGFDCVSRSDNLSGPLVNTAADTCASVAEATASGLSMAASLASSLNAPAPLDEITGFESGYHVDKESNIIVLLGSSSAYVIALQGTDEMFSWAETMSKIMTDSLFRVTLRLTEGGKLSAGIQGSLHVQHWRLCLIGEPSAGCKFICSWRLDAIEQAHTMTTTVGGSGAGTAGTGGSTLAGDMHSTMTVAHSSATSTTATTGSTNNGTWTMGSRGSFASENNLPTGSTHRVSLGNLSVLSTPGLSNSSAGGSIISSGSRSNVNAQPKHLLRIEANHSAGKGRGIHTFEVDGASLPKLTLAIEQLMALRYNPHGLVGRSLLDHAYNQQQSCARSHPNSTEPCGQSRDPDCASMLDLVQSREHVLASSSYSSDASGSRHSISPAQCFSLKQGEHRMSAPRRHSPFTMAAGSSAGAAGLMQPGDTSQSFHSYGQSVPVTASGRCPLYCNLNRPYSNMISSSSSLSPPDGFPNALRKHSDAAMVAAAAAAAAATGASLGFSQPRRSVRKSSATRNERSKPTESIGAVVVGTGNIPPRSSAVQFAQRSGDHLVARSASPQESDSLLTDDMEQHLSQSVFAGSQFVRGSNGFPQQRMHATTWSHAATTASSSFCPPFTSTTASYGAQSTDWRRRADEPVSRIGASSGELLSECHLLGKEQQRNNVVHVASGVIVSKNPSNRSFGTGGGGVQRTAPPLPPPLRDTARAKAETRSSQSSQLLPTSMPTNSADTLPPGAGGDPNIGSVGIHKSLPRPCRCHKIGDTYHVCRRHAARYEKQSAVAETSRVPCSNSGNSVAQSQGVFTADEDLWEAEESVQPPVHVNQFTASSISAANIHGLPTMRSPVQCPVVSTTARSTSGEGKKCSPSPSKMGPAITNELHPVDAHGIYSSPKSNRVLNHEGYDIYRNRCRQYRVCLCPVLQTRSLSSDASLILEFGNQPEADATCRDPAHSTSPRGTPFLLGLKYGVHSLEDFELGRDPAVSVGTTRSPLVPESSRLTSCCLPPDETGDRLSDTGGLYASGRSNKRNFIVTGGRGRSFPWWFHRKHSKSHDHLPINRPSSDKLEPVEHPISLSATEGDLSSRHPNARRSYSDVPTTQSRLQEFPTWIDPRHAHLILRCPRHGSQSYQWFALLRHSTSIRCLCSCYHKHIPRLRTPTAGPGQHSRRCVLRQLMQAFTKGSLSFSMLLNVQRQLQRRRRTREAKRSTVSSGEHLESSCSPAPHGRAHRTQAQAELETMEYRRQPHSFLESVRLSTGGSIINAPLKIPLPNVASLASPKYNRCRHCDRLLHSVLLLSCSEPSLVRFSWPVAWEAGSDRSSFSSLLTCRSFSASSSLSAYQAPLTGDGPAIHLRPHVPQGAKVTTRGSIPTESAIPRGAGNFIADTQTCCSLCDTDDLSSGSVCDECCLGLEHSGFVGIPTTTTDATAHLFTDHSSRKPGYPIVPHSVANTEPGEACQPAEYYGYYTSGKLKYPDRRTHSLCNPPAWFSASRLQSTPGPVTETHPLSPLAQSESLYSDELDKCCPQPQLHLASYSQRASTLPSAKISRTHSGRTRVSGISGDNLDRDSVEEDEDNRGAEVDEEGQDGVLKHHRKLSTVQHNPAFWNPDGAAFDHLFPLLFHRGSTTTGPGSITNRRRLARYNTVTSTGMYGALTMLDNTGSTNYTGPFDNNRKLSSQSDVVMLVHQFNDDIMVRTSVNDQLMAELPTYCNLSGIHGIVNRDMPTPELMTSRSYSTHASGADAECKNHGPETFPNSYVNLPSNWSHSTTVTTPASSAGAAVATTTTTLHPPPTVTNSLTARIKHLVQSFHHPSGSGGSTLSTTTMVATGTESRSLVKGLDLSLRGPNSRGKGRVNRSSLEVVGGGGTSAARSQLQSVTSLGSDLSSIPAEVRDPSRNYAIVDLRPSPASSVNASADLSLGTSYHQLPASRVEEITSAGLAAASMLGFSTGTSTGSDCTSDAATLTSDTMDGYAPVPNNTNSTQPRPHPGTASNGLTRPGPEFSRRRHSHSLSSAVPDPPMLNYVHVIAATAPFSTPNSARREGSSTVSEPIVCSIPEQADSHSSSSGLGGIASHSITPPLAPASSTSFGEIFTSRSMTSSATSSGEGGNVPVDAGFQSYSPTDQDSVAYTQLDFTRTMALSELSGDMVEQQQQQEHQQSQTMPCKTSGKNSTHTPFRRSQHKSSAAASSTTGDRSTSVRKSLSRSIRSIRSGNPKKPGVFLN